MSVNGRYTITCIVVLTGRDCSIGPEEGVWTIHEDVTRLARTSSATVLDGDTLWVIGGYDFQTDQDITAIK